MLCKRPSLQNAVFPTFDPAVHVCEKANLSGQLWLGVDFGFAAPFVCLWIIGDPEAGCYVIDEYVQPQQTIDQHIEQIRRRSWGYVSHLACDPAGQSRNDQTAMSNIDVLRRSGFRVHAHHSQIVDGIELIRRALRPASGAPALFIHPRCTALVRAVQCYRYAPTGSELPIKDGQHDHLIDALRYYFISRERMGRIEVRRY